ncbi:MAG TPA: DUF5362 family protein [Labilithrix sp.]|jgi:hypothetical protein
MNPYMPPADPGARAFPTDGRAGVSEMAVELMRQTKPWVMFIGVMTLIGAGFMALGGVSMMALGAISGGRGGGAASAALGLVYLPMAALYIYPGIKLWKYGSAINRLVASRDASDLDVALAEQKSFWKFAGIAMIVLMVVYALFFVVMVAAGVLAGASRVH